jgi:hypothetical protein
MHMWNPKYLTGSLHHHAWLSITTVLLLSTALPVAAQTRRSSADLEALVERWDSTTAGSELERVMGDSIHGLVREVLGPEVMQQWQVFLDAPLGTDEEDQAFNRLQEIAEGSGVRWDRAQFLLSVDDFVGEYEATIEAQPDSAGEAKPEIALSSADSAAGADVAVALSLHTSTWEMTEALHVDGVLRNESDRLIWIVDSLQQLRLEPQIERAAGEVVANFPLIPSSTVALAPHAEVLVEWTSEGAPAPGNLISRFLRRSLLKPRDYRADSRVFYATVDPRGREIIDLQEWDSERGEHPAILSPDWGVLLLLPPLWFGGVLVVLLQLAREEPKGLSLAKAKRVGGGVVAAVLLTTVIALVSFFSGQTNLLPSINMQSPGQAIAAGILIQLLGYSYYVKRLPQALDAAGGNGGVDPQQEV